MKSLYTQEQYYNALSNDFLLLECYQCHLEFKKTKKLIKYELKKLRGECKFCSRNCYDDYKNKRAQVKCSNCNMIFEKKSYYIKRTKNNFCSSSCAATYNNTHKTMGYKRSKLEIWLEQQLSSLYPKLEFHFNRKDAINSELDIYIPSLSLAFELNGIFHYEPIYGIEHLNKVHNNDNRKFQACIENNISLCIIDTSTQKKFKTSTSQKYLDIMTNIINQRTSLTS